VCVIAAVIGIGYGLGVILWRQLSGFIEEIPAMWEVVKQDFDDLGNWINQHIGVRAPKFADALNDLGNTICEMISDLPKSLNFSTFEGMGSMVGNIASVIVSIIMCMLSAYFFIAEREDVIRWSKRIAPDALVSRMTMVVDNFKYAVGGYFKAQFKIMGVVYVLLFAGFLILRIHFAVLLALLIAFLDFLPFFGTGTALLPWAAYKFMVGNYRMVVGLLILYGVTQLVRQLIQPKLVGDSMGLRPLVTLVLLYIGYKTGGVFGMIFAVPVGMIAINLYKAGAFDYILDDVKILAEGVMSLRN